MKQEISSRYDGIAPTALMVAHRRTLTDIPYASDIFEELTKIVSTSHDVPPELTTERIAPQIEARYKLIDRFLKESGINQIIELAAGFSPRGINLTGNPSVQYVETDLESVSAEKKAIIQSLKLQSKVDERKNLHLVTANALDYEAVKKATAVFDPRNPIAIIHEGLLRYLNFEEKATVANNVHSILEIFGGIWITPDITFAKTLLTENQVTNGHADKILQINGINIDQNRFEDVEAAKHFFENLGFTIEVHSFMEAIDDLVSPSKLDLSKLEVELQLKEPVVFVMRLAK